MCQFPGVGAMLANLVTNLMDLAHYRNKPLGTSVKEFPDFIPKNGKTRLAMGSTSCELASWT